MRPNPPATLFLGFTLAATLSSQALVVRVFSPAAHLRMTGFPANPAVNPTFLNPGGNPATRLDLSGIGWSVEDPTKQLTLVSPRHFVGANHFRPAVASSVRFLGTDNSLQTFTVASINTIPNEDGSASDVFLGEFINEVSSTAAVLPLPYLNLPTEADYMSEELVVAGQAARGGKGTIGIVTDFGGDPITRGAGIKTRAFTFSYAFVGSADDAHAEGGDSGSPSLAIRGGKAALVGTHTAVLNALGTITTYDTLVPHYAPAINSLMETTGLRLRKIDPPANSFSITGAATDPTVRAGGPFTCRFTVTNTSAADADNVAARFGIPPGLDLTNISAAGWRDNADGSIRRGVLAASASALFEITFATAPGPGTIQIGLALKSDGSALQSQNFPVTILPSYAGWAAGLAEAGLADDGDRDGISNLLEYAFGGDNLTSSRNFPGTAEPLLPAFTISPKSISFIRRTDAAARGLGYRVQRSTDLETGSWENLDDLETSPGSAPAAGFETIHASLPPGAGGREFYRLAIELTE